MQNNEEKIHNIPLTNSQVEELNTSTKSHLDFLMKQIEKLEIKKNRNMRLIENKTNEMQKLNQLVKALNTKG